MPRGSGRVAPVHGEMSEGQSARVSQTFDALGRVTVIRRIQTGVLACCRIFPETKTVVREHSVWRASLRWLTGKPSALKRLSP